MAYGDTGVFNPSDAQLGYSKEAMLTQARAEATKKAAYLSSMDQFYAELEAKEGWFDRTEALEKLKLEYQDTWDLRADENADEDRAKDKWIAQLDADTTLEATRLGIQGQKDITQMQQEGQMDLAELGYGYQDKWNTDQLELSRDRLDFEIDSDAWMRDFYEDQTQGDQYTDTVNRWSARTGLNPEWYNAAHNRWGFGG